MAKILAYSSYVARGHVGLSAIVPALQRLGHEVVALPTILLSNHPGHAHKAGMAVPPETLRAMLLALDANGWLSELDAVLTGYMPSDQHVAFAVELIGLVKSRRPDALVFCDPILGDTGRGLYIAPAAAAALRSALLPLADYASPNAFELSWLAQKPVDGIASAVEAARRLGPAKAMLVTSVPVGTNALANVLVGESQAFVCTVPRHAKVPNGTGDFMMAVFVAHCLGARSLAEKLASSAAETAALIAASLGADELAIVAAAESWQNVAPLPITTI